MSQRSELSVRSQQHLAALRRATGIPERLTHMFACKREDREFRATFARLPPAQRFTCESIERIEGKTSVLDRLRGWLSPAQSLKVGIADIALDSMPCAYCKAVGIWTLCSRCHALVCGLGGTGERFTCRPSCGASFNTEPLLEMDGARGNASSSRAINHKPLPMLPRR